MQTEDLSEICVACLCHLIFETKHTVIFYSRNWITAAWWAVFFLPRIWFDRSYAFTGSQYEPTTTDIELDRLFRFAWHSKEDFVAKVGQNIRVLVMQWIFIYLVWALCSPSHALLLINGARQCGMEPKAREDWLPISTFIFNVNRHHFGALLQCTCIQYWNL